MHFIDAHSHLSEKSLEHEIESCVKEAQAQGVDSFFMAGFDPSDWQRQIALQTRFSPKLVKCVFGMHPWWVARAENESEIEAAFSELRLQLPKAVALGELGLDFYPKKFGPETHVRQIKWFEKQLDLAIEMNLPIALHVVSAHEQVLERLQARTPAGGLYTGIVHGFSGNVTIARSYTELGLTLSIGNGALKKGYENVKRAIKQIDLKHWVLESDAPDQLRPADLVRVAQAVADIKGASLEEVSRITRANTLQAYRLSEK